MEENKILDITHKTQMNSEKQRNKEQRAISEGDVDGYGHDARIGDVKR